MENQRQIDKAAEKFQTRTLGIVDPGARNSPNEELGSFIPLCFASSQHFAYFLVFFLSDIYFHSFIFHQGWNLSPPPPIVKGFQQGLQSQFRCAQWREIARNCSRIARNCAPFFGVYRARNCAQVKSTCVGNPSFQSHWNFYGKTLWTGGEEKTIFKSFYKIILTYGHNIKT